MPEANAEHRHTPYSSLRSIAEPEVGKARGAAVASSLPAEHDYLTIEADRLECFKQALFAAFLAAPKSGIPTALVDLAATYTSALRLQMSLKGYGAVKACVAKFPSFATK
jgi:hypothetical protein